MNTAFYRILAPNGMSEFYILPSVPTQLLLREHVKVPDLAQHLPNVSPQLQVLSMGFPLGSLLLSKDGGELCPGSRFFASKIAHGSAPGALDGSGFDLFRGLR